MAKRRQMPTEFPTYFERFEAECWGQKLPSWSDEDLVRLADEIERRRAAFQALLDAASPEGTVSLTLGQREEGLFGLSDLESAVRLEQARRARARERRSATTKSRADLRASVPQAVVDGVQAIEDAFFEEYLKTAREIVAARSRGLPSRLHVTLASMRMDWEKNHYNEKKVEDLILKALREDVVLKGNIDALYARCWAIEDAFSSDRSCRRVYKRLLDSGKYVECLGQGRNSSEAKGLAVRDA